MLSFHKNRDCPTSHELLAYLNGTKRANSKSKIDEHLCGCDVCGAEAEFYSRFPQATEDTIAVSEIPDHLFELAEALLNNKRNGNKLLKRLIKESSVA